MADRITVDSVGGGGWRVESYNSSYDLLGRTMLASGLTPELVVSELPDLDLEDVRAALRFANRRFDHPVLVA